MSMTTYRVTWEIDVDERSPAAAAKEARACQQHGTTARFFGVTNRASGKSTTIEVAEETGRAVQLTNEELELLVEALDSHAYWELADQQDRNNGFVYGKSAKKPEVKACYTLETKLRRVLADEQPKTRAHDSSVGRPRGRRGRPVRHTARTSSSAKKA